MSRPKWDVAIHAPLAAPLYEKCSQLWTGGAELQSHYIARALATRGLRVVHIVSGDTTVEHDGKGVDLVFQVPKTRGPKGTRRVPAIWQALARADASVYIQRSAGAATGVVAAFARLNGRRFVYSMSSAADLGRGLLPWPDEALKVFGLRMADCVVTQTGEQQEVALRTLGPKATLVRSFCEPLSVRVTPEAFLWIGGLIDYKAPLAYLELAARVPEAPFLMVATKRAGWAALEEEVTARAASLPNVTLAGPRPRSQLLALYAKAVAVVGTSVFEGFPNTFMEAWACGVPALSLSVDPDGVIERHGLGAVANGSMDRLARLAGEYWARRHERPDEAAAKAYIRHEHSPAVLGDAWLTLIRSLMP